MNDAKKPRIPLPPPPKVEIPPPPESEAETVIPYFWLIPSVAAPSPQTNKKEGGQTRWLNFVA